MVSKKKEGKDSSANLVGIIGFWAIQVALVVGKLFGANISWWFVFMPVLVLLALSIAFAFSGAILMTRGRW